MNNHAPKSHAPHFHAAVVTASGKVLVVRSVSRGRKNNSYSKVDALSLPLLHRPAVIARVFASFRAATLASDTAKNEALAWLTARGANRETVIATMA